MIDRSALLADLQKLLTRLEDDLLQRSESAEVPEVGQRLREEYERAKKAQRTAQNYEDWRSDAITQAAAAWVLSCVFVRFLEDNRLIDLPRIAGAGGRLQEARDEWELYLGKAKQPNERDYLLGVFDELAGLPGAKDVFGEHNPVRELPNWLSGDGARQMLAFFQKIDANSAESNKLIHDFTDPTWDTRFLGDLYQDLSEAARKKYALLQTPEFVEEFILDRTLEPALDEFGRAQTITKTAQRELPGVNLEGQERLAAPFRMIDPACGSGHFLLGSFRRILDRWQRNEPGASRQILVQRALDSIHGVDVNPYAVAIARFRLLLVAMKACGVARLADAPAFHFNLVCGDSLLHAPLRASATEGQRVLDFELADDGDECDHAYRSENLPELKRILRDGQYHAVTANPPYIVPRDRQLNDRYRKRFVSCHRQYSLAAPFMERIFRLAVPGGFTGQITANSFMKREFGKKLIEQFLPTTDLTHVIDTSGAYIPGHGTPTVILFGRHRRPATKTIRTVMGIRGEPSTPHDPAHGLVWASIVAQVDQPGSQSDFVSVADSSWELFCKHPWSIGGGGAAELKEQLDSTASSSLAALAEEIGFLVITGEDNVLLLERDVPKRQRLTRYRPLADGEVVRDWSCEANLVVLWPNDQMGNRLLVADIEDHLVYLWAFRTSLKGRKAFGIPVEEKGIPWWAIREVYPTKLRTPLSIVFAFVATHNHFVLDRGSKVFNRSAPVIKLPPGATEDDHLSLVGLLNSSTACFWMKQVFHDKGSTVDTHGARQTTVAFENFREFTATGLQQFPLPEGRPLDLTRRLDALAQRLSALSPTMLVRDSLGGCGSLRSAVVSARQEWETTRWQMIALQEDLDWQCYRLYGLIRDDLTCVGWASKSVKGDVKTPRAGDELGRLSCVSLGQRAFEIVLARRIADGEVQTTWFERHGATPITELPADWPEDYKRLVERRIELIETDRNIALIEQPEYKRRWNTESWESQLERALRSWLLDRLESYCDFDGRMNDKGKLTVKLDIALTSVARLADIARQDPDFMQVGELYRNDPAFDVERLVAELVEAESVPLLPVLRYKSSGLRKRTEWEQTWELQREEDRTGKRLDVPVPPKYTSADFLKSDCWRLRGKLDVPKERWVSFPHCEGPDGTLVIAWAGYDHLQLARSVSAYYVDIQERLGGRDDPRLVPLLACLLELIPWLKQWHNEPDAAFDGMRMGDYFEGFLNEETRKLGKTVPEIKAWQPPQKTGGRKRK